MNRSTLTFSLAVVMASSCNPKKDALQSELVNQDTVQVVDQTTSANEQSGDTIVYDMTEFPSVEKFDLNILTTGIFHGNEVNENADEKEWFGLFQNENRWYLRLTKVKLEHANDPVLDENDEKTGWEVTTDKSDTSIVLIESMPDLKERNIEKVDVKEFIFPGDTVRFTYLGTNYTLFATGGKRKVQENPEWFEVWNYKLYLMAEINGQARKSLLVAHRNFDDQMTTIIFAGDIDGDGILDLIIDNSRHYNATSPTLYFSKRAEGEEILKPVAKHTSVGC